MLEIALTWPQTKRPTDVLSYVSFNQRVMLPRIFPFQAAAAAQSPGLPSTGFSERSSSKVGHPVTRSPGQVSSVKQW